MIMNEWKSDEDCKYSKKMVDANYIFKFLVGLNAEFDKVKGRIIGRIPLPTINEVFAGKKVVDMLCWVRK